MIGLTAPRQKGWIKFNAVVTIQQFFEKDFYGVKRKDDWFVS